MPSVLEALVDVMKDFKLGDDEELYKFPESTQYSEETSQKVADNLVMTDADWDAFHHDDAAVASQTFINCSSTVTELETIVIDSQEDILPMSVDLTHENDVNFSAHG